MSVLQLRRNMVVDKKEAVVEIEAPLPLRTLDPDILEAEVSEVVETPEEKPEEEASSGRSLFQAMRFWFNAAIILVVLAAYPAAVVLSSDVGDRNVSGLIDRTKWTAPWAGGAATLMERHFNELGWASDSPAWAPMARLTGKPVYQSAMAGAIGEYLTLVSQQARMAGALDADLTAAARLATTISTGVQLRAARDALVNFDRRLRRRAASLALGPEQLAEQVGLLRDWAAKSQTELAATAATLGGSPLDENATVAVYAAKGRAIAAYAFLETMHWPQDVETAAARNEALSAWKAAAEFHPLIVLNGSPDGSVFGNHPAAMGFLLARAQAATEAYRKRIAAAPAPALLNSAPAVVAER